MTIGRTHLVDIRTIEQALAMIDIGEELVGSYLSKVANCSVLQFNVRTPVNQAEIDVVGLKLDKDRVVEIWLCEVSTHTRGLGGYQGDAPGKIATKLASVKAYAHLSGADPIRTVGRRIR